MPVRWPTSSTCPAIGFEHRELVPETTDGGWTAEAGGTRLPVLTANGAFLAVRVPAGETEIVCRYAPPLLKEGIAISGLSGAVILALALSTRRRRISIH